MNINIKNRILLTSLLVSLVGVSGCNKDNHQTKLENIAPEKSVSAKNTPLINQYDGKKMLPVGSSIGHIEFISDKAYQFLDKDLEIKIEANNFNWMEGPLWVDKGKFLLFSDVPQNTVYKFKPGEGTSVYLTPSGSNNFYPDDYIKGSNGLLLDKDGKLIVMQVGDRRVGRMTADVLNPKPEYETVQSHYQGKRFNSPNDVVLHSSGSMFITDPPYGLKKMLTDPKKELDFQGVYRIDPDGTPTLLDDELTFPNGIGLSPDEKTLYVAVSDGRKQFNNAGIHAYDLDENGLVSNKRMLVNGTHLIDLPGEQGNFDGMAVHSSGLIFATAPGGVWLLTPDAEVLAKIRTTQKNGNCTLTADEKTLYIASDGYLLSVALK
ncbi:SMP-30/gluconolactonase/LRE family protein [Paraglaciecola aquimarina]|uniref:SMP-30/gluconolactonase/LRE family protein n=1 Tax=Paraglaciecola algarum TaxID=3050085 RepID=A0ABS9D5W2_9ALTE|nr:SMP-30/gluconolactonase/LRE family protein [Paraglaciecola sp. G1-23]MCF2948261.1 SMP-30/gluconolactonase/LRE family protein [Paraglaciecola sp. G1-23]